TPGQTGVRSAAAPADEAANDYDLRAQYAKLATIEMTPDTSFLTEEEREAVLSDFKARGFVVKRGKGRGNSKRYSQKPYVRLIHALWRSCAELGVIDDASRKALRSFVAARTEDRGDRVDDPEFLTYDQASPIIEALKSMESRGQAKAQK
ncbi:MAG: regulatory protein GemA, partial [Marinovum sp.]|nr:regulatory protein GemA [Marinovum sp.]